MVASQKLNLFVFSLLHFILISPSFASYESLNYETYRKVPDGPNPLQPPPTPPVKQTSITNGYNSLNYEINRKVPKGPGIIEPPVIPPKQASVSN